MKLPVYTGDEIKCAADIWYMKVINNADFRLLNGHGNSNHLTNWSNSMTSSF